MSHSGIDRDAYNARLQHDMSVASRAFQTLVVPTFKTGSGETVINTENTQIDHKYGVDWQWLKADGSPVFHVSARVLRCHPGCITLRKESYTGNTTELEKRRLQFKWNNDMKGMKDSYLIIHAVVSEDWKVLNEFHVVKMFDVITYLTGGGKFTDHTNPEEGNKYISIDVEDMRAAGVNVLTKVSSSS